ncbi:mannitol-1-phosphate 5-dehydrogenase [Escherichia coli]|uniref:Mannitol-1-phosphate 5-dehydrogenase n=1 Tax=Escherichia coli TaxID=562 RepID=A0A1U9SFH8_ECOLX|nr:mannitol-1-phosphate 5-dehydrogenase [Escherichia coli]OLN06523.1 mannitol-1-phosphate 5-dehydrogenase [Shigella flexneri]AQV91865.1 mannitol-1-phosphate 5-dehydrogenase [Escherichia coli]ARV28969.1 mannitol-1-phosphate 5-dehydrogenase [Escherichia coli]ARV33858.1 mannitol-1-phosphate 5-dehydrogenase [Escherichia coli]
MSDATLTRLIRPTAAARCVLDKAFTPHPARWR